MADFDAAAWEREESERWNSTSEKLLEIIGFEVLRDGVAPVVEFTCPRGHGLRRWRAEVDHHDDVFLEALPGLAKKSGPITRNAFPGRMGDRAGVCAEPGCGTLVRGTDFCAEHGGGTIESAPSARTNFSCPQCSWSDDIRLSRLLKLYGLAVALGHTTMSLSGAPTRRRR